MTPASKTGATPARKPAAKKAPVKAKAQPAKRAVKATKAAGSRTAKRPATITTAPSRNGKANGAPATRPARPSRMPEVADAWRHAEQAAEEATNGLPAVDPPTAPVPAPPDAPDGDAPLHTRIRRWQPDDDRQAGGEEHARGPAPTPEPARPAGRPPAPETGPARAPARVPARRTRGPARPPAAPLRTRPSEARTQPKPAAPSAAILTVASLAFLTLAVAAFTRMWVGGSLALDGPGVSLFVRLSLDHWRGFGVPYWLADMWSGSPAWSLAPSFPILMLVPLGAIVGPDNAVKLASVAAQVVGAWGAFVLARSLWHRTPAAVVAGFLYGLHPLFASHALFGHETSLWVMAATPWIVWTLRLALRGAGARYVALAGLTIGFAILQQAEHVYALAILCGALLAVEVAHARLNPSGPKGVGGVMFRAGVVVLISLGTVAHWLLPFMASHADFVLTTPDSVRAVLVEGIAGDLGKEMGLFVHRAAAVHGTVGFEHPLLEGNFYLSWVALALSLVTLPFLGRNDDDGCLTAVLFASAVGVWMSTAAVPLASSGPAERRQLLPFIVVGSLAGLLVGSFIRRLRLGRAATIGGVVTACLLVALPYFAPFLALQRVIPFLESIRFPRFYHVAALGVSLGAAYPLVLAQRWAETRKPRLAPLLAVAAGLAVIGLFLVDAQPYRSYYRTGPPGRDAAYQELAAKLAATGANDRVAIGSYGDPDAVNHLLETGKDVTTGWPHPLAGRELWRLSGESFFGPPGYRDAALGLSGTSLLAEEQFITPKTGGTEVSDVNLVPNPLVLPMVRAYDQAVVVGDPDLAPVLAVSLAQRNIGVVTGGAQVARRLGPSARAAVPAQDPCAAPTVANVGGDVAGELAMSCAVNNWVGVYAGLGTVSVADRPGAVFQAPVNGLRGVSVWLDRPPHPASLTIWELAADGRSLGDEVATVYTSGFDPNGIALFAFDPIPDSAGKRYAWELSCPSCSGKDGYARLATAFADGGSGNLLKNRNRVTTRIADFSLLYDRVPVAAPSSTTLEASRAGAGRWRVDSSGPQSSIVVVAEAWFPGWKATVDGKPAPVLQADGAFLGVAVGPGEHRIAFTYHIPTTVTVGRAITFLTLVAAALLLIAPSALRRREVRRVPSRPAGDTLQVGAPARRPRREAALDAAEPEPRLTAGARLERPRRERDEAVLAGVGDVEPRLPHQSEERRGSEPRPDRDPIPLGMHAPPDPDHGVVLDRLRQHEMTARPQYAADLGENLDGIVEMVEDVDAPDEPERPVTEW